MKWMTKNSLPISFVFVFIASMFTTTNVKWGDQRWHKIIDHDANGYYAYLPALFIYNDLNFNFYDQELKDIKKENSHLIYDYREDFKGNKIDKYYIGTAVAELPFFLMAHGLSSVLGYESNGYSKIYYVFISLAAIFYLMIGLWFLSKYLSLYKLSEPIISISILSIYFGTHLFYYSLFEPGMSHVFSFSFISMLLYFGKKYFIQPQLKTAITVAVLLGMITIIRPVNSIVVLLIPFLAGSSKGLIKGISFLFQKTIRGFLISIFSYLLIISIQLIVYKIQTGYFFVYSYTEEGFNFLDPQMINILFSYKKGLFLYTPILLIALPGFYFMYLKNKFETISLVGFFLILTYILSSWWCWWYGGSYSSRVYVDYLGLFVIPFAILLSQLTNTRYYKIFILLILFLILFNQKQTYLYRVGYIHWVDMDKEKYWESSYHLP